MAFLQPLLTRFGGWLANRARRRTSRAAEMSVPLPDQDTVTRLLYTKSHFSRQTNRPKPAAFDPSPHTELSTMHITGMTSDAVWRHSEHALGDQPGRQAILSRADVPVALLTAEKLRAVRDDDPFERHTLVLGWPEIEDANERKAAWKQICLHLSQSDAVRLVLPSAPVRRG